MCVEGSVWRAAEEKMVAIVEIVLKSRYFLITRAVHNDCSGACTIYKDYVFYVYTSLTTKNDSHCAKTHLIEERTLVFKILPL